MAVVHTLAPVIYAGTIGSTAAVVLASSIAERVTSWSLQNQSTISMYVGGSAVTTTAGWLVTAGSSIAFDAERLRTEAQTYALANYYVITGATNASPYVILINRVTDR